MSDPPLRRLVGQNALVTGSTRGIGRTIAEWLAREGANIVVSGRERDAVEQSATAIRALGVEAWSVPSGLARVSEAHRLAEASLSLVPRLNILVNIAGMSIRGHVWEVSDAVWEEPVNVRSERPLPVAPFLTC
ncbi:MAG TPA: SDR family NAD(P)-dependent oxidoreductase [Thermomicrobiales bacterium]|nr:SDR family NAD(P)-dependent oxidoreductase [Thermomicrobiales bacterium]